MNALHNASTANSYQKKVSNMAAASCSCSCSRHTASTIVVFLLIASTFSLSLRLTGESMKKAAQIFFTRKSSKFCSSRNSLSVLGGISRNILYRRTLGSTAESKTVSIKVSYTFCPLLHPICKWSLVTSKFRQDVDSSLTVADIMDFDLPTNNNNAQLLKIRHTTAHVMAMAVQRLFPKIKCTIGDDTSTTILCLQIIKFFPSAGPWIENGWG